MTIDTMNAVRNEWEQSWVAMRDSLDSQRRLQERLLQRLTEQCALADAQVEAVLVGPFGEAHARACAQTTRQRQRQGERDRL